MKPLDPRLLKHARASAFYIGALVVLGVAAAGLVIFQAQLLATAIAGAFIGGDTLAALRGVVIALAVVLAGRALVAWATEAASYRASAVVKAQLRDKVLARAMALGPRWLAGQRSGELTALTTGGIDALDGYFAKYLPQLILSVVVPVAVLARVFWSDWLSGLIIVLTLPLIPVFGALVGKATGDYAQRRWEALARLSHHFLDVVTGLTTLKIFGRSRAQRDAIGQVTGDYRQATMGTLRVAFLSALVLELVATISVALVAVAIGLRLVGGHMSLQTGLMVLILAPEAYLPLRQAGAQFHASADGLAAAEQAFAVIEEPLPADGQPAQLMTETVVVDRLSVTQPGRKTAAPDGVSLEIRRGEITAVAGPSGSGKSTLLSVLLGFAPPSRGTVTPIGRSQVAWVPQDPTLFAGTVASNIRLGWPSAPAGAVRAAARAAALTDLRLDRPVGDGGSGLSAGQRRRVALARALLPPRRQRPVLLLDEPTAGLDAGTEARVLDTLRSEALAGRAILVAAHHPAVLAVADHVVELPKRGVAEAPEPAGVAAVAEFRAPRPVAAADETEAELHDRTGRRLTLAALLGVLASCCAVGLLATSAWLISRAAQHPPVLYLLVAVTAVRAFGIGRAVFRYGERLAGHDAALRILARLRVTAWDHLEKLAPAGLAAFRSGDLLSRVVRDVDSLADRWLRVRLPYLVAVVAGGVAVTISTLLVPRAGLVLAASLVTAAVLAPVLALAVARHAEQQIAPRRGELATAALDALRGAGELSVFGAAGRALRMVTDAGQAVARGEGRSAYARGTGAAVALLAAGTAIWAGIVCGVPAVRSHALAGVGLAVVVLIPLAAHELFASLAPAAQEIPRLRAAGARVSAMMTQPDPVTEPTVAASAPAPPYDLRIRNLTARWDIDDPDVLHGFSLDVAAGQRAAIIGPSGSGKTTLAMVLLRFLDPAAGSVTLGGTDVTALDSNTVRRIIGLCAQDAHIFDSSLEANLRLARPGATDTELRDALRRARLLDWVDSLPAGLATPVGEHGAQLSGGQRQRLALARVLLADFPVVILDEPAEHLDEDTAEELTHDLLKATEGRTVLLITHRPVDLGEVDQVVTLGEPADQAVHTSRPLLLIPKPRIASAVS
ncbi:MAG: thiol reductant ABC exporter subunit CydD [Actinobacteria bacterium]|nr:thiol reductant ABC exporter subunit CydD [Actinomycetota bacterium]